MKKTIPYGAVMVFLVVLAATSFAEELRVAGGGGPVENILKPIKPHFEKATGITLNIMQAGGTAAFKELAAGRIEIATAGMSWDDLLGALKKESFEVSNPAEYQPVTIGKGGVFVLVHKDNPVAKLSKEQLKGIFTGKIGDWRDLGGKPMPILVVLGKLNPGTNNTFQKQMLDGEPYTKDLLEATTAEDVRVNVASNPEAIAFGPSTLIDSSVRSPETPEVSRPIILVTRGKLSPNAQKLINYINNEGKEYIKK
ncbi:MAG: substrate-binding domain-containing protein [Nitrospirae bacterium]|nr:substrate-binding domain-containing protein [Nitrospirota bacterium]